MDVKKYFLKPISPMQKQYEALRAFYIDGLKADETANKFGFTNTYFKKIRFMFASSIADRNELFFRDIKKGPKRRFTRDEIINLIIDLRKKNHSIEDIKTILNAKGHSISLDTIHKILKAEGFASLPRRTKKEILGLELPQKIVAPETCVLEIKSEKFSTERGAGPLLFLPLINELKIIDAIERIPFPQTKLIPVVSSMLSILALKLVGIERYSHDKSWNFDRALGLFANLNVLPKNATLSSYSYRVTRSMNKAFLLELSKIFSIDEKEFNLDFKSIPHWGSESILEKNWSGSKSKVMKSVLAAIVQNPSSGILSYTNAEVKHRNQNDVVLEFVDFWREGHGEAPKMLIFDSKFTTYENLSKLNKSPDNIKFLTIRRRGKNLTKEILSIREEDWQHIQIEGKTRKYKKIRVFENKVKLRKYEGSVRQMIITDHGRIEPTFMITNDFNTSLDVLIKKYARRWLVEQEIAEHIDFFHLNNPSSSIVVKVDFDLTLSLLAHNLYKEFSNKLTGFERCRVDTINRNFIENGADITIANNSINVDLRKKTHLPILMDLPWLKNNTHLKWMNKNINFSAGSFS